MKNRGIILALIAAFLLSGCVYDGQGISLESILGNIPQKNQIVDPSYSNIDNVIELRNFVDSQREQGNLEFSFIYSGENGVDPGVVAQMADVCYVKMIQEGNIYHLELKEFPGERIVRAYKSDDASQLSRDEKKVLETAMEMVEEAKKQASDNWELELLLHDMLAEHITYSDADIYYEKPEDQPRHLSVIGALLDGEANCQGYTDAFYTLASIAGFQVERLSVETFTDPHMVNIICLEGQWYVVDVTYDDSNDSAVSYQLFNAGLDLIGSQYSWSDETECNSIVAQSDEKSYYIRNHLLFTDLEDLAEFIAEDWAENGNTMIQAMLLDESDSEKINEVLPDALEKWEKSYSYSIWYNSNGKDSFYTVIFD